MNTGSDYWKKYSLEHVKDFLDLGYDGVHLDDVWGDLIIHDGPNIVQIDGWGNQIPYADAPKWYSKQTFKDNMKSYIQFIGDGIERPCPF